MAASYTSMLLVLIASLIPVNLNAAGFSLPLISKHDEFKYRSDGFFRYDMPATTAGGGGESNLTAIRPRMASVGWSYAVQVGVGTGPGLQFYMLELDLTGDLTWLQCAPSVPALPQESPIFNSSLSPSFVNVDARRCKAPYTPVVGPDRCAFQAWFHGASAHGYLGIDSFLFANTSGIDESVPGIVFGCAHTTEGFQNQGALAGVLSMSRQRTSLITQLGGARFSYCLAPQGNWQGFLRFGDDVTHPPNLRSTEIMFSNLTTAVPAYHIRVVGVLLNGEKLTGITAPMFGASGCRIDVGSPMSRMIQPAYNVLEHEVAAYLARNGMQRFAVPGYRLCLLDNPGFREYLPSMALELYGGTQLDIAPQRLFVVVGQYLCFAIVPDEHQTVLGALQQVNTHFIFDLSTNKISFASAQCS